MTVFAAASLTESFAALGEEFEAGHDGSEVEFNFAASSELAAQIEAGAPADVFASADEPTMDRIVSSGMNEGQPRAFARNVLAIAVPESNPGDVRGLDDFAKKNLRVAVCDVEVPCGNAAAEVFRKAGVEPSVDTYETDVKAVLTKVELGEVDAGLVYASDVLAAGDKVDSLEIPEDVQVVSTYPIVTIRDSADSDAAAAFIDLVLSEPGQAELENWGFRKP